MWHPEEADTVPVYVWISFSQDLDGSLELVEITLRDDSHSFGKTLIFTLDTTDDNVAKDLGIFRSPAPSSLDPANVEFIKRKLASTEDIAATSTYRPKRLLDIGVSTQSDPKLIDVQEAEVGVYGLRYAALSYCWGPADDSKNQLRLTAETQREFYNSIPPSSMTPVLRDAITVCRVLGVRFLWVDSICIQQDGDNKDWEEQSQEMSHIFGSSWLTICAAASNSCLEGFLDHTDRHSGAFEIEYVAKEVEKAQGSLLLRLLTLDGQSRSLDCYRFAKLDPLRRDLESTAWDSRGWVFQERILSPRLLYFGSRMIHFQHGDNTTSENGFYVRGDFHDHRGVSRHYRASDLLHQLRMIQNQGPFITDFWYKLVAIFNPSNFTDRKDTFPAISGIARRVHEVTKHRYLAGLWEEDLCCGLLWDTMPRIDRSKFKSWHTPKSLRQLLKVIEKADTIAPSWSWASRRSRVEFRITDAGGDGDSMTCRVRRHLRADFKILQSRVLVDGVNPFGRIGSASISLLGTTIGLHPDALGSAESILYGRPWELFPDFWAFVEPDWSPLADGATGIKTYMRLQFQILLIASCCSDWSRSSNTQSAQREPHNERAGPKAGSAQGSHESVRSSNKKTYAELWVEANKPEYRDSFYEDSHPGFDAAVHCDLCSDHTLRRDIWGLLLYPAGPVDTYYRVGTFMSRAQHGGSGIFEGAKPRRIVLV